MKFFSTRNKKEIYHFDQVLIKSTAKDGGLFVPENLPHVDQKTIKR
jgi:threonine synthase